MAQAPSFLTLKDNRDDPGTVEIGLRRALVLLLGGLIVLALLNTFGQEEKRTTVRTRAAVLSVVAPTAVRGGLFYQGRFTIQAEQDLAHATLVFDRGWTEGMHINTIEPAPVGESSRDGLLALDMGHVAGGDEIVLYMQFQVNPTNLGRRSQSVTLYDDDELIAVAERKVTVFP